MHSFITIRSWTCSLFLLCLSVIYSKMLLLLHFFNVFVYVANVQSQESQLSYASRSLFSGSDYFTISAEHVISTNADGAYSVYAIDVDGDGDVDVLSASLNDDKVAWYENDGSQSFTEHVISTNADNPILSLL